MNIEQAKIVMLRTHAVALARGERANALYLVSGPGVGKSDGVFQYCAMLARAINQPVGLVQFMLATVMSADVRGFMLPAKRANGLPGMDTYFSTPPWFPTGANCWVVEPNGTWHRDGEWTGDVPEVGVLFLDEWAQAEEDVKKPAAELLYKGQVGTSRLPPGWRVVAAGNRMTDRSGVMREMMFLVNRRGQLTIDPDLPTWQNWRNSLPVDQQPHYLTASFAEKSPELVFRTEIPNSPDPFCTPRSLCLMDKDLMAMRSDEDIARDRLPLDAIAREVAQGWIGEAECAKFYTHIKYADQLPDLADIERNPQRAKLPTNIDAQMVAAFMMSGVITEKNADAIMVYTQRLNIEMQVLAIRNITGQQSKAGTLLENKNYINWLADKQSLLRASRS